MEPDDFAEVLALPLDDGLVLSKGRGRLYMLNYTGRIVWQELAAGRTPEEAAAHLADRFQIPVETATRDVTGALDEWRAEGLLSGDREPGQSSPDPPLEPFHPAVEPEIVHVYRLLGRTIRMRFDSSGQEAGLHPLLAHARIQDEASTQVTLDLYQAESDQVLMVDGRMAARHVNPGEFKAAVLSELLSALHPGREWIALLHAAVVGLSDGREGCLVLSAGGGSGKTTLAAALAKSGFLYMSDDTTALDRDQVRVAALPLGLSIKPGGRAALVGLYPEIHDLIDNDPAGLENRYLPPPATEGSRPARLPARALIFPGYWPGAAAEVRHLSGMEALERLVASGVWISPQPGDVTRVIDWIKRTPAMEMTYGDLDTAVALVRQVAGS
jgi:hypothetical protein